MRAFEAYKYALVFKNQTGLNRLQLIFNRLPIIICENENDWLYISFQIISAQQLPKINTEKASSIVDPQVWVEIHGVAIDNARKKTHRIDNNGKSETSSLTRKASPAESCLFERIIASK